MELDYYDKEILYELDRDARVTLSKLSKKLRRSKPFILHRIKRFEQGGIITGYTAIVDMSKLGYFTFRIYLDLQQSTEQDKLEIIEYVKKHKQIWTITTIHGVWDLALFLGVKNIQEFHVLWDDVLVKLKEKIKSYNVAIYAPIYNYNRVFFLDKTLVKEERIYGLGKKEDIKELDWKILQIYSPAVRQSSLEIAKKLEISADTVRAHIRTLIKKKIIVGHKIGLNLTELGYFSYRIDFELNNTKNIRELMNFCKHHKNIYQINKTIGGADFEIEVILKSEEELTKLIDEIKSNFKDMIKDEIYFRFSTFHMLNYIPD